MQRVVRIFGTFGIVLVSYCAYAILAVPFIEPPADPRRDQAVSTKNWADANSGHTAQRRELEALFPPGSWELQDPKILESDQVKVLIQRYENLGDGLVDLFPCTMIFSPDAPGLDPAERMRQSVVLEAPEGAKLRFEKVFDPQRLKIGRLVEGHFPGRVTIRSQGKLPGPEDDLMVVTRDVQLTEQHVWTMNAVDFRWGPHNGRGQEMHIRLLPRDTPTKERRAGPNVGRIEQFELRSVEYLHMDPGGLSAQRQPPAGKPSPQGAATPAAAAAGKTGALGGPLASAVGAPLPVEIRCRGPFLFHVIQQVATFRDQVDVLRIHPSGPSDRLICELLTVYFTQAMKPAGAAKKSDKSQAASFHLEPHKIEAQGQPAVLTAPLENAYARADRMEYDLHAGRIVLDGPQEVVLRKDRNEIHAPHIDYQAGAPGRLGKVFARGPGWMRGQTEKRPDQQMEARWNEQLEVRPQEQNQVISLYGGARIAFHPIGRMDAREIHFWMLELPQAASGEPNLQPDRMLAKGDVRVASPQLTSAVDHLELWFEQAAPHGPHPLRAAGASIPGPGRPPREAPVAPRIGAAVEPPQSLPAGQPPAAPKQQAPKQQAPKQHMEITGRVLRARVVLTDMKPKDVTAGRAELVKLTIEGQARLAETQTALPGERPLLVTGDVVQADDANGPGAVVTIVGRPAHFEGRGLSLTAANIHLDRGANRLWIDGGGRMQTPLDRDLQGQPLRTPGMLQVDWQKKMDFDGRTAHFEDHVVVHGPPDQAQTGAGPGDRPRGDAPDQQPVQELRTQALDVQFQQMMQFSDPRPAQQLQVEQILCSGGVFTENRTFEQGQPVAYDRMQVPDLRVNLRTGALTAGGPGWLVSVRRGTNNPLQRPAFAAAFSPPFSLGEGRREGAVPIRTASGGAAGTGGTAGMARGARPPADRRGGVTPPANAQASPLNCMHLRYQGSITGNVLRREMTFHDQVRVAYAPTDSWTTTLDSDDPDKLGAGGIVLHCNHLSVNEITTPGSPNRSPELLAVGNVVAEGRMQDVNFTALAIRMSYAEAKDLLVLEGDGRTDAELFRQEHVGSAASRAAARKIFYWPKSNRFKIDGARSLDFSQPPAAQPKPDPSGPSLLKEK